MERFVICMLIGALLYGLGYLRMRPSRPSWTVLALLAGVVVFAFLLGAPNPSLMLVLPGILTGALCGAALLPENSSTLI
jgi:peptidoglycan/LPS O-acetylase OafA/YrhL